MIELMSQGKAARKPITGLLFSLDSNKVPLTGTVTSGDVNIQIAGPSSSNSISKTNFNTGSRMISNVPLFDNRKFLFLSAGPYSNYGLKITGAESVVYTIEFDVFAADAKPNSVIITASEMDQRRGFDIVIGKTPQEFYFKAATGKSGGWAQYGPFPFYPSKFIRMTIAVDIKNKKVKISFDDLTSSTAQFLGSTDFSAEVLGFAPAVSIGRSWYAVNNELSFGFLSYNLTALS